MKRVTLLMLGTLAVALPARPAHAGTIHVRAGASIQAAVDAAADGDTIVCGRGTFRENVVVSGRTNLSLVCRGATIQAADEANAALTVQDCSKVRVSGAKVEGGAGGCVRLHSCHGLALSRTRVHATAGAGVSATTCENVSVTHCVVAGGSAGASMNACTGVRVGLCQLTATAGAAVDAAACAAVKIDHDVCAGTGAPAIQVTADASAGASSAVVVGNRCTAGSGGISVTTATSCDVHSNVVSNCGGDGISVTANGDASGCLVVGNRVRNCGDDGIAVGGGSNCQVTRNVVSVAVHVGIRVSGTADVVARNRIIGCGGDALVLDTQGATIQGNAVADAGANGIVVAGDGNSVDHNQVNGSADAAVQIDASASGNVIGGNTCSGTGSTVDDHSAVGVNTLINGGVKLILGLH